jgi:hypothetical protein
MTALPNIVLVHGAWANGSGWNAVIEQLQADGYRVAAPAFSLARLADDVARSRQILGRQNRPTPPDAQRQFAPRMGATTVEVSTNHVAMVSHLDEVLQLIKAAAEAVVAAT